MTPPADLWPVLQAHLPDLELRYASTGQLVGMDPEEIGTLEWTVTGVIPVSPDVDGDLSWTREPGVTLSERRDPRGGSLLEMFTMSGFTIDLTRCVSLVDVFDSRSDETALLLPLVDPETGDLKDDLLERLEGVGYHLVVIDQVILADAWRRQGGIGRLLIGHSLRWLGAGAWCVVVRPDLFTEDLAAAQPDVGSARQVLYHTWGFLGFSPYTDELYVLDPALRALDEAIRILEGRLLGDT
jgi:hypothetical protein